MYSICMYIYIYICVVLPLGKEGRRGLTGLTVSSRIWSVLTTSIRKLFSGGLESDIQVHSEPILNHNLSQEVYACKHSNPKGL